MPAGYSIEPLILFIYAVVMTLITWKLLGKGRYEKNIHFVCAIMFFVHLLLPIISIFILTLLNLRSKLPDKKEDFRI